MRRWVMVIGIGVVGVVLFGLVVTAIQRQRLKADKTQCLYRFQRLGQFAAVYAAADLKPGEIPPPDVPLAIPPGTVPNLALQPDERLSWIASALPLLDQSLQDTAEITARLDLEGKWNDSPNDEIAPTRLNLFLCPGAVPDMPPGEPAPTQFVGLAGIGPDAATLPLGPPVPPRAGCFRYDTPTPLEVIRMNDGLSVTYLFAETSSDLGPWIRGGFSTVRGLDVSDGAKPPLGRGGQFGGNYPGVAGFGRADGSAGFVRDTMSGDVLRARFTIAGQDTDPIPGE